MMRVQLDLDKSNVLSVEQTRAVMRYINGLQEQAAKAGLEIAALKEELAAATLRAEQAEAAADRLRATAQDALADLRGKGEDAVMD